jgi:hypothetical protein
MAVGYIAAAKEQLVTYQPLMLVEITMSNGNVLRLASHMLAGTIDGGGGFPYGGNDYLPRLMNTDISETQALSEQGIDFTPSVSITIADPDGTIYNNWETSMGFKGATMVCRFVLWNVGNNDFSTDSVVKFTGLCQQAECPDSMSTRVTAVSKMNMVQAQMPSVHVQPTCPWSLPSSLAQSQDAADNDDSPCWECGYAPLATGGNIAGNLDLATTMVSGCTPSDVWINFTSAATSQQTPFWAVFDAGTGSQEVVNVVGWSGTIANVVRGQQGTIGVAHSAGASVEVQFNTCDQTRQNCMIRMGNAATTSVAPDGDIFHDEAGRSTGRFGGVQYMPAGYTVSRGYLDGKWQQILNTSNQAKYGDLVPVNYGTTWVDCLVLNSNNDANYSNYEVMVGYGQHQWVYTVVINGVEIPHTYNDSVMSQVPNQLNAAHDIAGGWWAAVNDGRRNSPGQDSPVGGDPYGSLCVLHVCVPNQVASGSDAPQVQVWVDGPALRVYTTPSTYTKVWTDNPAWVMLDAMFWAGLRAGTDIDIASFISAAAKFGTQISYTTMAGGTSNTQPQNRSNGGAAIPYSKHAVSLSLSGRTCAADVLRGLRNNCKSLILPNMANGLISLRPKETLASQQLSTFQLNGQNASNYNAAVSSVLTNGTASNGYLAYWFDESNIVRDRQGNTTFKVLSRTLSDSPNAASVTFQNFENSYNQDSLEIVDTEDLLRVNSQVITGNMQVYGTNNFDRTRRALAVWMAEQIRGNPRTAITGATIGDTGGTMKVELQTSFRGIHLSVGDIIGLTYQQRQINSWLFRITSIQPGMNARTIRIQATYHNDGWYLDTYGQQNAPLYRHPQGINNRLPYSWCAGYPSMSSGDSMYFDESFFQLWQEYTTAADNTSIARVHFQGRLPVNNAANSPQPPMVLQQATTATTGGTIPGGQAYYIGVAAKDAASSTTFNPSYLSYTIAVVSVPGSTNTNTISVNVPFWDVAAKGYVVFMGTNPGRMSYQADGNTTPASITITGFEAGGIPAPDPIFDHFLVSGKVEIHGGVFDAGVISCTSTTIKLAILAGGPLTTNQFAGYDVSVYGLQNTPSSGSPVPSQSPLPMWSAKIASNTGDTLTLAAGLDGNMPDPTTIPRGDGTTGLAVNDWIVMRSKPTVGSDSTGNYIEDTAWINNNSVLYLPVAIIGCTNANPGAIQTATAHGLSTGDKAYIQSMGSMTGFPLLVTVTVVDTTHFSIGVDTTAFGAYSGSGGVMQKMQQGLGVNTCQGELIWFIAGPGRGVPVKIASNTNMRLYIDGAWPSATPDSTSRYIVVEPTWLFQQPSQPFTNSQFSPSVTPFTYTGADVDLAVDVSNYEMEGLFFLVQTADADGNLSLESLSPFRDTLILGQPPAVGYTGSMAIGIDGTLAIGSDQGPRAFFNGATTLKAVRAEVKNAPIGAALTINISAGATLLMTLVMADGTSSISATTGQISAAAQVPANTDVTIDITGVGTTFPGSDLTVSLFY